MNTEQIMEVALKMAKMKKTPSDSGIYVRGAGLKRALFSIDVDTAEVLLGRELGCDAVIAHHPIGRAVIEFSKVVHRHVDFMVEKGVPRKVAEDATKQLVERIEVRRHPANYEGVVSAARELRMPLMNIHLPIDQITREYLLKRIQSSKAKTVGALISKLGQIPEFNVAATRIELIMGKPRNPLGRWVLVFAAGTNGGYPVAKAYFENGIDTIIYLHIDYEELVRLRKECSGNLIVLGHIAGDSIGINMFLRELLRHRVSSRRIGVLA